LRSLLGIAARYQNANRTTILVTALALLCLIAVLDWAVSTLSLAFLYFLPVVLLAGIVPSWQLAIASAVCCTLRIAFDPYPFTVDVPMRMLITFGAFFGSGLFVAEVNRRRAEAARHLAALQEQIALRYSAQDQLSVLIETSPAAIMILDFEGSILHANASAAELLGCARDALAGANAFACLPALATVPRPAPGSKMLRSSLECRGKRFDGGIFLAQIWFSAYCTSAGPRIAAILLDESEGLRDREGAGFASLVRASHIIMGAVSHSVRNLSAASKLAWTNLSRVDGLAENEDFRALGTLINGLESIACAGLTKASDRPPTVVDLDAFLDDLRIVIEPSLEDAGIDVIWNVSRPAPPVLAEHYGLLHAALNIVQNSQRALAQAPVKRFEIGVRRKAGWVQFEFTDSAGGVPNPEVLFEPFCPGAHGTGLGLFVSRAIVRSFDGELRYEPAAGGSRFTIKLAAAYDVQGAATAN
jgi:two-component system sensor kinase FixL